MSNMHPEASISESIPALWIDEFGKRTVRRASNLVIVFGSLQSVKAKIGGVFIAEMMIKYIY